MNVLKIILMVLIINAKCVILLVNTVKVLIKMIAQHAQILNIYTKIKQIDIL